MDDVADKQMLVSLLEAGKISDKTFASLFNIDKNIERRNIVEEQKAGIKDSLEVQNYQQKAVTDLTEKAKQEEFMTNSSTSNINQEALMQEADAVIQRLEQMEAGQRKSELDRIQKENFVMYAMVTARMRFEDQKAQTANKGGE